MLMPDTVMVAMLPALSVAVPVTCWLFPSVDNVWSGVQVDIPDVASEQTKWTVTLVSYHPFEFAEVVGAPLIVGGVAS